MDLPENVITLLVWIAKVCGQGNHQDSKNIIHALLIKVIRVFPRPKVKGFAHWGFDKLLRMEEFEILHRAVNILPDEVPHLLVNFRV
jgi:hypothetical protein